jgi:hypothetical protein
MAITTTLLESDSWCKFVADQVAKDAELQRCIKDYMAAHAKLTNRVAALAKGNPDFDLDVRRVADGPVTTGLVEEIRAYLAKHGKVMTADQISAEARNAGYDFVHIAQITEKRAS